MRKSFTFFLLFLLLSLPARAQRPEQQKHLIFDAGDAVLVGGMTADEISSHYAFGRGAHEAGLLRNTSVRIAGKAAFYSLFKWYEYRHPDQKRKTFWIKIGAGIAFAAAAAYASTVSGRRSY